MKSRSLLPSLSTTVHASRITPARTVPFIGGRCVAALRQCAAAAAVACSMVIGAPAGADAQTPTITWDANPEPDVAGYVVLGGTQPGTYTSRTDTGAQTSLPIVGVDVTKDNYFAVEAYTSDGLISALSMEVFLPAAVPQVATTLSSFTANMNVPLLIGTPVTWTARASSGTRPVEYKFVMYLQQTGWTIAQDYSPSNTFTWTPGWNDVGKAALQVWVRAVGSTAPYEAWRGTDVFDVNTMPARLTADTAFPSPAGQPVLWTAQVAGSTAPLEYRFVLLDQSTGTWSALREYAPGNQVSWVPAHNGKFGVQVWVRRVGSTAAYEMWTGSGDLDIAPSRLAVTSVNPDKTLPATIGTALTWTARTAGGTAGPIQYKFLSYSAQTATWKLVQDYSTSRTYTWTPTWGDEGFHVIQVWARSGGSTASYDAWLSTEQFEIRPAPLQITTDSVFPVAPLATVRWTAEVPDPSQSLEYAFYVYDRSKGTWSLGRPYNPSNTFIWTPGATGTYALQVWARRVGSTAAYDVWRGTEYLDVFYSPAHMKSFKADRALPASAGTPITWTATASGGTTASLEYRFIIYNATTGWRVLKEYGSSRSVTWTPGVQEAGTYALQVWVRSAGSADSYEDWQGTPFFVIQP